MSVVKYYSSCVFLLSSYRYCNVVFMYFMFMTSWWWKLAVLGVFMTFFTLSLLELCSFFNLVMQLCLNFMKTICYIDLKLVWMVVDGKVKKINNGTMIGMKLDSGDYLWNRKQVDNVDYNLLTCFLFWIILPRVWWFCSRRHLAKY